MILLFNFLAAMPNTCCIFCSTPRLPSGFPAGLASWVKLPLDPQKWRQKKTSKAISEPPRFTTRRTAVISYYVHSKKRYNGRSLVKSKEVLTCSVWAVVCVIRPCFLRGAQNICVCCGWNPQSLKPSNFGVYSWATQTPAVSERYDEVCMFDHFWTISCFLRLPGPRGLSAPNWFNVWVNIKITREWM